MDRIEIRLRLLRDIVCEFHMNLGMDFRTANAVSRRTSDELVRAFVPLEMWPSEEIVEIELQKLWQNRVEKFPDKYSWDAEPVLQKVYLEIPVHIRTTWTT